MDLKKYVANVKDFPKEGILFRDITPLMNDGEAFKAATDEIVKFAKEQKVDLIVGPEARGFIFGCPVSYDLYQLENQRNYLERLLNFLMI